MDIASRSRAERERRPPFRWRALIGWLAVAGLVTAILDAFRDQLESAHIALAFLLVVLFASAREGRVMGLVLSVVCFLSFNFFLLPPFLAFDLHEPLDFWSLFAFLVTGMVAAQLLHRSQRALELAESLARELDRLAAMGAESLSVPRAVDGVRAIARVIRTELAVVSCRIQIQEPSEVDPVWEGPTDGLIPPRLEPMWFARTPRERVITGVYRDGSTFAAEPGATLTSIGSVLPHLAAVAVPLQVRERVVGVLALYDPSGLKLQEERARFADALTYYTALAVERVRLAADSEHVEALLEADRVKDAVLASVSHDLRTPLTSIQAMAAELRETGDDRAVIIEEEAVRLNRMVTDLLDLSSIRMGSLPLELQLIAGEDVVGAALQRIGEAGGSGRVDVRLPSDGSIPVGRIDFNQTLRIVVNLLENGLRHSHAGGRVELDVEAAGEHLILRVSDRGSGIPEVDRLRIFEPFFRGQDRSVRSGRAGLGLAIARSLAVAQGGTLEYHPRPGGGSVFELRLPAEPVPSILG